MNRFSKNREKPQRKTPVRKVSKRNWWIPLRARLKVAFERAGITRCEMGRARCLGALFLGFAHSKKRRFIVSQKDRECVALLCVECHNFVELMPRQKMEETILNIIANRESKVIL